MEDSQFINAPETPGPVFAYRAFRNYFVGSPESSPIRPLHEHIEGKENTYIADSRYSAKRAHNGTLTNTTPKRLRINGVSPSKSILRNPSEPTPRRAMLKDVSVTFKDARKSMTPDSVRRTIPTRSKQPIRQDFLKIASQTSTTDKVNRPLHPASQDDAIDKTEAKDTTSASTHTRSSSAPTRVDDEIVPFNIKEYLDTTEKEMRKLLKYGQKMREIAKKQEEETARLKLLLIVAQKETARVQAELRKTKASLAQYTERHFEEHEEMHSNDNRNRPSNSKPFKSRIKSAAPESGNSQTRYAEKSANSASRNTSSVKTSQRVDLPHSDMDFDFRDLPIDLDSSHKPATRNSTRLSSASKQKFEPTAVSTSTERHFLDEKVPDVPPTQPNRDHDNGEDQNYIAVSLSHMDPNKVSAARQRLERKRQARQISNGAVVNGVNGIDEGMGSTRKHSDRLGSTRSERKSSALGEGNNSQLDWVGL